MILPTTKPRISEADLRGMIPASWLAQVLDEPLVIVGIRGYYRDTMGKPGVNDRGIYDDAILIWSKNGLVSFNGNTDPSAYRRGKGTGGSKGMASLLPGVWKAHRFDLHNGKYLALCQRAGPVTVIRDGDPPYRDTGMFGINIHKGSYHGTSSLGCQTIPPSQWDAFIALAVGEAKRFFGDAWKRTTIPYLLLDTP